MNIGWFDVKRRQSVNSEGRDEFVLTLPCSGSEEKFTYVMSVYEAFVLAGTLMKLCMDFHNEVEKRAMERSGYKTGTKTGTKAVD